VIEFVVIVVGALVIVDVVYELTRLWISHAEQRDANQRAEQRANRRRP
jgi:hypothetical protein